jgi:hypothetical protein
LKLDTQKKHLFTLKGGIPVTGNIKEDKNGKGTLEVFINHVLITMKNPLVVDPTRAFSGWINCDGLTPQTARDGISPDHIYNQMMEFLLKYVARFPKIGYKESQGDKRMMTMLRDILKDCLDYMKLNPPGKEPKGPKDPTDVIGKIKNKLKETPSLPSEEHGVTPRGPRGPNKPRKVKDKNKNYNDVPPIVHLAIGNRQPPFYYDETNKRVIANITNSLYPAITGTVPGLGPNWFRIAQHWGRVCTQIDPNCKEIDLSDRYKYEDRVVRHIINMHKEKIGIELKDDDDEE